LEEGAWRTPWKLYTLLSYGFLHSPNDLWHILGNMFGLWFFGRDLEYRFGKREFLTYYLVAIICAGAGWMALESATGQPNVHAVLLGASGGTVAVAILFALLWPRRKIYIWGLFPVPMWALAIFIVLGDLRGATDRGAGHVAYTAHLVGASFALLYFRFGWRLSSMLPSGAAMPKVRRRPKLRVHDPVQDDADSAIDAEIDDILRKIQTSGQDSLTRAERKKLEAASREYQKRRR